MKEQDRQSAGTNSDRLNPLRWMRWVPVSALALLTLIIVYVGGRIILIPLLASLAIAYLLAPIVSWFEKRGWSRQSAVILTIVMALIVIILGLIFILPSLWHQINISYHQARLLAGDYSRMEPTLAKLKEISPQLHDLIRARLEQLKDPAEQARIRALVSAWLQSGLFRLVNLSTSIFDLLLTPFFTFYLLSDYRKMRERIDRLIPPRYRPITADLISRTNFVLSSYVRSQLLIATFMGVLYTIGFLILGVPLAVSLGLLSGLLNFIPYIGTITGLSLSLTFMVLDGAGPGRLIALIAVFILVQNVEGYFLTPKLLGDRLKIHPLLVLSGLVIGGKLFGLIGFILAVPVIAVSKVLLNFLENLYQQSDFYRRAGYSLLSDQGQPLDLPPTQSRHPGIIIPTSSPASSPRSVITTSEIKSRVPETDPFPED